MLENTSQLKFRNNVMLSVLETRETQAWKHDERLFRGHLAETLKITVNTKYSLLLKTDMRFPPPATELGGTSEQLKYVLSVTSSHGLFRSKWPLSY